MRLARIKEVMLRQPIAWQNGGRVGNGIGVGAETVQRDGRAKGDKNGQLRKFHGLVSADPFLFRTRAYGCRY
jgi:hypothetical protein